MKKTLTLLFSFLIIVIFILPTIGKTQSTTKNIITISDQVIVPDVLKMGINLGSYDQWGAANILKNLFRNPGFEDGEMRQMVPVAKATTKAFQEDFWDASWYSPTKSLSGKPVGFWTGADYEIMSGPYKGKTGKIINFTHEADFRLDRNSLRNTYYVNPELPQLDTFTIIAVRKKLKAEDFYPESGINDGRRWTFVNDSRPGSTGTKAMKLVGWSSANDHWQWRSVWSQFIDSYGRDSDKEAGKLLLIEGDYKFSFWAKSEKASSNFKVVLQRSGVGSFISESAVLGPEWKYYEFKVNIPKGKDIYPVSSPQPISIDFYIPTPDSTVYIDDVFVGRISDTNPTAFADEVVNKLKEYRPGVLRYWGIQLGSSLLTQIKDPYARGTFGHRPDHAYGGTFDYSLHEFLELSKEIGAEPWYVVPPILTKEELRSLVDYLSAPRGKAIYDNEIVELRVKQGQLEPWTDVFSVIHLEYGNEMWGGGHGGDPFYGASAVGGPRTGEISSYRFGFIKSHPLYNAGKINLIAGGQAGAPLTNKDIAEKAENIDTLAIAPYFGSLNNWATDNEIYQALFASPDFWVREGMVKKSYDYMKLGNPNLKMAIYENNFHTTWPDRYGVPQLTANNYVAGFGGAIATSLHSLKYLENFGIKRQTFHVMSGFSFKDSRSTYPVRLWGMLRDVRASGRKRPTWLGIELINQVIRGSLVKTDVQSEQWIQEAINSIETKQTIDKIQAFAFKDSIYKKYGLVIYNLDTEKSQVTTVNLPTNVAIDFAKILKADNLNVTNENSELIKIENGISFVTAPNSYTLNLNMPKHSVMVLSLTDNGGLIPKVVLPTTPTGLTTSSGSESISLTWNKNTENDLLGYNIFRSSVPDNYFFKIGSLITENNFIDNNVIKHQKYYYKISAVNQKGYESILSLATSGIAGDTQAPTTPTNLKTTTYSTTEVDLSWTASTDNIGVAGYKVFRSSSQTGTFTQITDLKTTSYRDSNLTPNTTYWYKVSAYDNAGNQSVQTIAVDGTSEDDSPVIPAIITHWPLNNLSNGQTTESISGLVGKCGTGCPILGEISGRTGLKFSGTNYLRVENNALLNTKKGITIAGWFYANDYHQSDGFIQKGNKGTQYRLTSEGNSYNFILNGVNNGSLKTGLLPIKNWHHIVATYNGSEMVIYLNGQAVARKNASGNINVTLDPLFIGAENETSSRYSNFVGLLSDFRVYNYGLNSTEVTNLYKLAPGSIPPKSTDTQAPTTPTNLKTTTYSTTEVDLSWTASTDNIGVAGYKVFRSSSQTGTFTQITDLKTTSYRDSNLTPNTTYWYKVSAYDNAGNQSVQTIAVDGTTKSNDISYGLISHWPLNNISNGQTTETISGLIGKCSSTSCPTLGEMLKRTSLKFSGSSHLKVDDNSKLNPQNEISISGWFYANDYFKNNRIIQKGNNDNQYRLLAEYNKLVFHLSGVTNGYLATNLPSIKNWHHIVATYNGSDIIIYLNGQIIGRRSASGKINVTNDPLFIGTKHESAGTTDRFNGYLSDIKIWDRSLSQTEIDSLYKDSQISFKDKGMRFLASIIIVIKELFTKLVNIF